MVPQVTARQQIHDQVQSFPVLEGVVHVNDKGVFQPGEEFSFIHDGVDAFFADDFGFKHFLHGEEFFGFFELYAPDFAKTTLTDHVEIVEMKAVDFLGLDDDLVLLFFLLHQFRQVDFEALLGLLP